jgi:hypothetical protein
MVLTLSVPPELDATTLEASGITTFARGDVGHEPGAGNRLTLLAVPSRLRVTVFTPSA